MPYTKLFKLARKLELKQIFAKDKSKEELYTYMEKELIGILGDMEGDLLALKQKGIDKSILKALSQLHRNIKILTMSLVPEQPYRDAHAIVAFLEKKETKTMIDNLEFIIHQTLKAKEVEHTPHSALVQVSMHSLKRLLNFKNQLKTMMAEMF